MCLAKLSGPGNNFGGHIVSIMFPTNIPSETGRVTFYRSLADDAA